MKVKHYLIIAGGYFVAAYVYNKYLGMPLGFAAPLDVLSMTIG